MNEKTKLFISYARADSEDFAERLHNDLTKRGFDVWWDKKSMQSRGRTFLQEITDAIYEVDRLVLVVSPAAAKSDYVAREWNDALSFGKPVTPVLHLGGRDCVPHEFAGVHYVDFMQGANYEKALDDLARILAGPVEPLGKVIGVPGLPANFLPRPSELMALRDAVLSDLREPVAVVGTPTRPPSPLHSTGLHGMGGIGKTVLATALARDFKVRAALPDGIIWVTVGQTPNLVARQVEIASALGEAAVSYEDAQQGRARLSRLLADKRCLIILDDVWRKKHADAFDALGPRCRLVVTTRDSSLITALGARECRLDVLSDESALDLLAQWADKPVGDLPPEARQVAEECGNLPLALSVCGAHVRDGTPWSDLLAALRVADLEFLDHPQGSVMKSLKVSIDALPPEDAKRYLDLAVFPSDESIPESAVVTMWQAGGDFPERYARKLITTLKCKALLNADGEAPHRRISLHDLFGDYIRRAHADLVPLHNRLLDAYAAKCPDGWPTGPNDSYFFERLAWHMIIAGRTDDLRTLLLDYRWFRAKLDATDIAALILDVDCFPVDTSLQLVQGALRLSSHVLARDKNQLAGQLCGRLSEERDSDVAHLICGTKMPEGIPRLFPLRGSLTPPGGPLLRTLEGHTSGVTAVAVFDSGRKAISASWDDTLTVWHLEPGREIRTLRGHTAIVTAVAVFDSGRKVISGSHDNTLKVWDLESGREIRALRGHTGGVTSVAMFDSGRKAISGSDDNTLKVWDLKSGRELRALEGHNDSVTAVAVFDSGRKAISGSHDTTLKVWDLKSGRGIRALRGHTDSVTAVAVFDSGRKAISGSHDNTLKVWDLKSGRGIRALRGHTDSVTAVAVFDSGRKAISASHDNTLKVWDLKSGRELRALEGHNDSVTAVAVFDSGRKAISGSDDNTLKVWDLKSGRRMRALEGHNDTVTAIAVFDSGRKAISGSHDNTLKVWDLKSGREICALEGHTWHVTAVAVFDSGRKAISASSGGTLKVWDLEWGREICALRKQTDGVTAVAVFDSGRKAISVSYDRTFKVWDLKSGRRIRTLPRHTDRVTAVAVFDSGRKAISGSEDSTLTVLDLESGREISALRGNTSRVTAVSVFDSGRKAISGCWDTTLKVWNLKSGRRIRTLRGHTDRVTAVAAFDSGRKAISGSWDHTLKVWDIEKGAVLAAFTAEAPLTACAVSLDGHAIVCGDQLGRMHLLRFDWPD